MKKLTFPLLSEHEQKIIYDALHYMNISELRNSCRQLALPDAGNKGELIERIMSYIQSGVVVAKKEFPAVSRTKSYPPQSLSPQSLILHGAYKNDAQTRALFKSLVGNHFHFTAFGIDWLNERWLTGNPPTYQEFADYWIQETDRRKHQKAQPKKEWAYINFLQQAIQTHPNASKDALMEIWKRIRSEKATFAKKLIHKIQ